jgi:peptidoglycan-associated lipoprotein
MRTPALLLLAVGLSASAAAAQLRMPPIIQRVIPGTRPQPPVLMGIDALRAEFVARSGSDRIYFGGDSSVLDPSAKSTLDAQAGWLRLHPQVVVRIEGHADPSDTRDHALAVGARRAQEVRDYLILIGVPAAQLTTVSWGKERVAVMGSSDAALALNRRAVTVLVR